MLVEANVSAMRAIQERLAMLPESEREKQVVLHLYLYLYLYL